MTSVSLDQIVKNILMKRSYSLHWYIDFIVPAKDCLRELSFDLPINPINYAVLTLDSNCEVDIPDDYVDYAGVFVRQDQYLIPLVENPALDTIPNYDSDFNIQPYIDGVATQTSSTQAFPQAWNTYLGAYWFMVNWDILGENLGRQFGGIGGMSDTFKVDIRRNKIKINETLGITECVVAYISNGLSSDSATRINSYAQAAIESYCLWMFKENHRTYSESEAQVAKRDYEQQVQILRARLSDLTLDRFKRIVQSNVKGIKY